MSPPEDLPGRPKNPESFWTFDRILPSLGKRCVLPNLALPTVAALTPRPHEVVLWRRECQADRLRRRTPTSIGITGFVVHGRRMLRSSRPSGRRGKLVVSRRPVRHALPRGVRAEGSTCSSVGEAEYTWPAFLRDYETGRWPHEYEHAERQNMLATRRYHDSTCSGSNATAAWPSSSRADARSAASSATSS
jgi:hypothetical protein